MQEAKPRTQTVTALEIRENTRGGNAGTTGHGVAAYALGHGKVRQAVKKYLIWDFDGTLGYREGGWTISAMVEVLR